MDIHIKEFMKRPTLVTVSEFWLTAYGAGELVRKMLIWIYG